MSAVVAPIAPVAAPTPAPVKKSGGKKKTAAEVPSTTTAPVAEIVAGAAGTTTTEAATTPAPAKKASSRKAKASATETAAPVATTTTPPPVESTPSTDSTVPPPAADATAATTAEVVAEPVKRKTQVSKEDVLANNKETETSFKALLQAVKDKKIQGITKIIESLKKHVTRAGVESVRAIDQAKKSSRRKNTGANAVAGESKKPSGLDKPIMLSPEFAAVIKVDPTVPMTRGTAIHKLYYDYIVANGLKTPGNGRRINPDPTIQSLLSGWTGDDLNYITIRAYLKHHFTQLPAAPAVAAPIAAQ